jgi:hypothetical protein
VSFPSRQIVIVLTNSQIAAQYGNDAAADALKRSSSYGVFADPYDKDSVYGSSTAANPALTTAHSRAPSTLSTGYNSQNSLRPQSGVALFDRHSFVGTPPSGGFNLGPVYGQGQGQGYNDVDESSRYGTTGSVSDAERERYQQPHGWAQ